MRLLIDNTGLQSGGAVLTGSARAELDVQEFLQLLTLFVFSDSVCVGGYETDEVRSATKAVADRLGQYGIDSSILSLQELTEAQFTEACTRAAVRAATVFHWVYTARLSTSSGASFLYPVSLDEKALSVRVRRYASLLSDDMSTTRLTEIREEALTQMKAGAVEYMIAIDPELRRVIRNAIQVHPLSPAEAHKLDACCRLYLNDELAHLHTARYAPAVSRGSLIRQEARALLDILTGLSDEAASELRGSALHVPSIVSHLLERSQGDPHAMLEHAMTLRERAAPLRGWLTERIRESANPLQSESHALEAELRALSDPLKQDLGLRPAPNFAAALEIQFVLGVPIPSVSGSELIKWLRFKKNRKVVAILSELSRSGAFARGNDIHSQRLADLAMRRQP